MTIEPGPRDPRRRAEGSLPDTPNTDDRILDATAALLASGGAPSVTLAAVARGIGTSIRPVHNRVASRGELLATTWRERLCPGIAAVLSDVIDGVQPARTGAPQPLLAALATTTVRSTLRDAGTELLLNARFHPPLAAAVDETLGAQIRAWTHPTSQQPPQTAARHAFVLALALGLMIGARHQRARTLDLPQALPTWVAALQHDSLGQPLPTRSATHIDEYPVLAPDDPALDILLNTALEMISQRGFDQVTVAQIARAAGFTEGLVFSRYATKLDMLLDATRRQNEAGLALNHAFTSALQSDFGTALAEAVLLREAQLPSRVVGRSMALEQIRLGWRHAPMAQAQNQALDDFRADLLQQPGWADYESETDFFLQMALSWGAYLLPFLSPDVYALPYDVILIPLYARFEARREGSSDGQ